MMTVSQDAHVRVWNTRTFQQVPVKILQVNVCAVCGLMRVTMRSLFDGLWFGV